MEKGANQLIGFSGSYHARLQQGSVCGRWLFSGSRGIVWTQNNDLALVLLGLFMFLFPAFLSQCLSEIKHGETRKWAPETRVHG